MASINQYGLTPTIIGIADATHYLVGLSDGKNNLVGFKGDVAVLNSLAEAKQYLRSQYVESATLEFQTAYDEMCGSTSSSKITQVINL